MKRTRKLSLVGAPFALPLLRISFMASLYVYLLIPEPIIAPVKLKKFSIIEQDLPQTSYDMESVLLRNLLFEIPSSILKCCLTMSEFPQVSR